MKKDSKEVRVARKEPSTEIVAINLDEFLNLLKAILLGAKKSQAVDSFKMLEAIFTKLIEQMEILPRYIVEVDGVEEEKPN